MVSWPCCVGADDAVAESEPRGRHLERALPRRGLRSRREHAGQHGFTPAEDRSSWWRPCHGCRATGVRLGDAEEEAGQRRGGGGCPAQLYSTGWIGAVEAESRRAPIAPAIAVETHGRMSSCGVCVFLRW
jgi:hypothetical protein